MSARSLPPLSPALRLVLEVVQAPAELQAWRGRPLPDGISDVVHAASGADAYVLPAAASLGAAPEQLVRAARTFLREVAMHAGAEPARVLALPRGADPAVVRQHHRWLMHWLHPDRLPAPEDQPLASRLNQAWQLLRAEPVHGQAEEPPSASARGPIWAAEQVPARRVPAWLLPMALVGLCGVLLWMALQPQEVARSVAGDAAAAPTQDEPLLALDLETLAPGPAAPMPAAVSVAPVIDAPVIEAPPAAAIASATNAPASVAAPAGWQPQPAPPMPPAAVPAPRPQPEPSVVAAAVPVAQPLPAARPTVAQPTPVSRTVSPPPAATPSAQKTAAAAPVRAPAPAPTAAAPPTAAATTARQQTLASNAGLATARQIQFYLSDPGTAVPPLLASGALQAQAARVRRALHGGDARQTVKFDGPIIEALDDGLLESTSAYTVETGDGEVASRGRLRLTLSADSGTWLVTRINLDS